MNREGAWKEVRRQSHNLKRARLHSLVRHGTRRLEQLTFTLDDLTLDLTKEKLDGKSVAALVNLARAAEVEDWREQMAQGLPVNMSERQPALHMALRSSVPAPIEDDVEGELQRFLTFAEEVRSGEVQGKGGKFESVLHIGVGGSDLGPRLATTALAPDMVGGPCIRFVSNLDSSDFFGVASNLDPEKTLVIVSSKSFKTTETIINMEHARSWLGSLAKTQLVAVTANPNRCIKLKVSKNRIFRFWNWVGGRYSIWSAVGLPLAIGIGAEKFLEFLEGAAAMDHHFLETPLEENLPVLLAMAGIWRRNFMEWPTVAIVPYSQQLAKFPAYIQQLEMESNGKQKNWLGKEVKAATAPVVWGEVGTNAQHSFFQLLHQGTDTVPVDFVMVACSRDEGQIYQQHLNSNCLAQGMALALGQDNELRLADPLSQALLEIREDDKKKAKRRKASIEAIPGDRPSTTILFRELTPYSLGRLIALYEHKVFVQGIVWEINSFNQPGVELGKSIAQELTGPADKKKHPLDPSTKALQKRLMELEGDNYE